MKSQYVEIAKVYVPKFFVDNLISLNGNSLITEVKVDSSAQLISELKFNRHTILSLNKDCVLLNFGY